MTDAALGADWPTSRSSSACVNTSGLSGKAIGHAENPGAVGWRRGAHARASRTSPGALIAAERGLEGSERKQRGRRPPSGDAGSSDASPAGQEAQS